MNIAYGGEFTDWLNKQNKKKQKKRQENQDKADYFKMANLK